MARNEYVADPIDLVEERDALLDEVRRLEDRVTDLEVALARARENTRFDAGYIGTLGTPELSKGQLVGDMV